MKTVGSGSPVAFRHEHELPERQLLWLRPFFRAFENWRREVSNAINTNAFTFVSQAAQPTVPSGEVYVWEDSDAGSGQPTHYLVINHDGTTVTFASEETVP